MAEPVGEEWAWRDLGPPGAALLEQSLEMYAFTGTWEGNSKGAMTLTNRRNVALTAGLLSRIKRSPGAVLGFLPEKYPDRLLDWIDVDDRPADVADSVARRFLGLDNPSSHPSRFVIALDYTTSVRSKYYKKFWAKKPEWLHPAENGDVVHWICPVPEPPEATSRLADALSWSSPFPHMALSGDAEFDAICERMWTTEHVSDAEETELSDHVRFAVLDAFDFMVDILWVAQHLPATS
jgi:hypothetical protein